jgi:hypothetical protein
VYPMMNYLLRTVPPDHTLEAATAFDNAMWEVMRAALRIPLISPRGQARKGWFQRRQKRVLDIARELLFLPVGLGGMGIQSAVTTRTAAYVGSWSLTMTLVHGVSPDIADDAGHPGLCHWDAAMADVGDADTFGSTPEILALREQLTVANLVEAPKRRVQKELSKAVNDVRKDNLVEMLTKQQIADFTSASTKYAGAWVTALPGIAYLQLSDAEFISACLSRMLVPLECIMPLPDQCPLCQKEVTDYTDHVYRCLSCHRGAEKTGRHDHIVRVLAKALREEGNTVGVEPLLKVNFQLKGAEAGLPIKQGKGAAGAAATLALAPEPDPPDDDGGSVEDTVAGKSSTVSGKSAQAATAGAAVKLAQHHQQADNDALLPHHADPSYERSDISIRHLGSISTLIDVTVAAVLANGEVGAGASRAEAAKIRKYNRWNLPDVDVVAFALERNGCFGEQAAAFVEKVAGMHTQTPEQKALAVWRLVARVAVALQRGNARYVEVMTKRLAAKTGAAWSPAAVA